MAQSVRAQQHTARELEALCEMATPKPALPRASTRASGAPAGGRAL